MGSCVSLNLMKAMEAYTGRYYNYIMFYFRQLWL